MKATELLVACLENEGGEFLFALPGEENLDGLDSPPGSRIRVILVRPEDVAASQVDERADETALRVQAPFIPEPLSAQVKRAIQAIRAARRPLILAGNGVVRRRAHEAVRRFARALNIPVVHTFMGKGIMPDSDPLSLYTLGLRLRDYPALAMEQADVVIAVCYDIVEYAPCYWNPNRDKRVGHGYVSPAAAYAHYIVEEGVLGDLALSLEQIGTGLSPFEPDWAKRERERIVADLLQGECE